MDIQDFNYKQKIIIFFSIIILIISVLLNIKELFENNKSFKIEYEYINIKDMAAVRVSQKKQSTNILYPLRLNQSLSEYKMDKVSTAKGEPKKEEKIEEVKTPVSENSQAASTEPKRIWYLPTETGIVTQNPSYTHFAHDITSYRGTGEVIHPIANGTVSGMYRDAAGAIIVTVLHNVDGKFYTSQYVHLSRYASGLYVGKKVTINDSLGQMGTTGNSTGVHLHIAVLDCALFSESDPNCRNINDWYRYGQKRYTEGFYGLWSLLDVPGEWYSR